VTVELLIRNWALVVASIFATGILVFVLVRLYRESDRGQLGNLVRELQGRYTAVARAQKGVDKATERLDRLRENAPTVKPRHVEEAGEAVEDALLLLNNANDQVLIAEKDVRQLILDEYPPNRHEALRQKYLNRDAGTPVTGLT
jgi:hypothetical protein